MSEKIEEWINVDQAAEFFGVKPATIREWIRKVFGSGEKGHSRVG